MARLLLSDREWELIADFFPAPAETGRPRNDPRKVVDSILWVLRTGSPWRDLPQEEAYVPWQTAWRKFDEWHANETLAKILQHLQASFVAAEALDNELWCLDGTVVRAHRCAGGGGKKVIQKSLQTMR